jgi:hypothetical protein
MSQETCAGSYDTRPARGSRSSRKWKRGDMPGGSSLIIRTSPTPRIREPSRWATKRSYALLDAVIGEVSELFTSSRYIHIGMDEAWFPAVPDVTPELDRQIAAHVMPGRGHGTQPQPDAHDVGRHGDASAPGSRGAARDIVMIDWRYWIHETDAESRTLREAGFHRHHGPAIMWYETRVHPGTAQLGEPSAHDRHRA